MDIYYGTPIPYEPDGDPVEVTTRLMDAIGVLVEKAQADYPEKPAGPEDSWWLPAHLGGSAPTIEEADAIAARDKEMRRMRRLTEGS